jgi:hypothetical protein
MKAVIAYKTGNIVYQFWIIRFREETHNSIQTPCRPKMEIILKQYGQNLNWLYNVLCRILNTKFNKNSARCFG